jgi:hypothetical protein
MSAKQWILSHKEKLYGPYTMDQLKVLFDKRKVSWLDLVREYQPSSADVKWIRLGELFTDELASSPVEAPEPVAPAPAPPPPKEEPTVVAPAEESSQSINPLIPDDTWYLQFGDSQFGPMTLSEAQVVISGGRTVEIVYAWREGMLDWVRMEDVPELRPVSEAIERRSAQKTSGERRGSPRMPLIATVMFTMAGDTRGFIRGSGVCRDISSTGMMIISSQIPGYQESTTEIEVKPLPRSGLPSFTVEAIIRRILPQNNGFGVEFKNLDPNVRSNIEKYLSTPRTNMGPQPPVRR